MKKIIYIDESNTSGSKFQPKNNKLVGCGIWIENKEVENYFEKKLKGLEIKGSDLMTREYNSVLKWILDKLSKDGTYIGFTSSFNYYYMIDRTFTIFYPWEYSIKDGKKVDGIRQKLCAYFYKENFQFMNNEIVIDNKNLNNLRSEILTFIKNNNIFSKEEFITLNKYFKRNNEKVSADSKNENPHSAIIEDAIAIILKILNSENFSGDLCIVIDDFTDKKTKELIEFNIKNCSSAFKNINVEIQYKDSKKNIGLQIADWIASIPRKSFEELIKIYNKGELQKNKELIKFHQKIVKWCYENFKSCNCQVTVKEIAWLQAIAKRDLNNDFYSAVQDIVRAEELLYIRQNPFDEMWKELENINTNKIKFPDLENNEFNNFMKNVFKDM